MLSYLYKEIFCNIDHRWWSVYDASGWKCVKLRINNKALVYIYAMYFDININSSDESGEFFCKKYPNGGITHGRKN